MLLARHIFDKRQKSAARQILSNLHLELKTNLRNHEDVQRAVGRRDHQAEVRQPGRERRSHQLRQQC